ncbi:MAG: Sir2 family NAD-dependent protein deacetylase, partial [Pirellulales bacterium]
MQKSGAGISAESGLQTFRGADGLWEGHRVEDVTTPEAWAANPGFVQGNRIRVAGSTALLRHTRGPEG